MTDIATLCIVDRDHSGQGPLSLSKSLTFFEPNSPRAEQPKNFENKMQGAALNMMEDADTGFAGSPSHREFAPHQLPVARHVGAESVAIVDISVMLWTAPTDATAATLMALAASPDPRRRQIF